MELHAKDLQIGDWVSETIVGIHQWSAEDYQDFDERYITPIPLTAEILEKNGLRHTRVYDNYDEWIIDVHPFSSWWLINVEKSLDEGYEYSINDFPLKYAHQLQHALRLCGLTDLADNLII